MLPMLKRCPTRSTCISSAFKIKDAALTIWKWLEIRAIPNNGPLKHFSEHTFKVLIYNFQHTFGLPLYKGTKPKCTRGKLAKHVCKLLHVYSSRHAGSYVDFLKKILMSRLQ